MSRAVTASAVTWYQRASAVVASATFWRCTISANPRAASAMTFFTWFVTHWPATVLPPTLPHVECRPFTSSSSSAPSASWNALRASAVSDFSCLAYSPIRSSLRAPCMCAAHTSGLRTHLAKSEASRPVSSET